MPSIPRPSSPPQNEWSFGQEVGQLFQQHHQQHQHHHLPMRTPRFQRIIDFPKSEYRFAVCLSIRSIHLYLPMSVYMFCSSVSMSKYMFMHLYLCLSIRSIHLYVCVYVLLICLSLCFVHLTLCLYVLFTSMSVYMFCSLLCQSICSVHFYVSLYVLFIWLSRYTFLYVLFIILSASLDLYFYFVHLLSTLVTISTLLISKTWLSSDPRYGAPKELFP